MFSATQIKSQNMPLGEKERSFGEAQQTKFCIRTRLVYVKCMDVYALYVGWVINRQLAMQTQIFQEPPKQPTTPVGSLQNIQQKNRYIQHTHTHTHTHKTTNNKQKQKNKKTNNNTNNKTNTKTNTKTNNNKQQTTTTKQTTSAIVRRSSLERAHGLRDNPAHGAVEELFDARH